jgi:DNA-binding transcriptional regulator YiaG
MTCEQCGGRHVSMAQQDIYHDDGLIGLPNVVVINAAQKMVCDSCGANNGVHIPDPEDLEIALAVYRVTIPVKLSGKEIRFLRQGLGKRASELGQYLQVRDETVSRWENEKEPMKPQTEKLLRILVGRELADRAPGIDFDEDAIWKMQIPVVMPVPRPKVRIVAQRICVSVLKRKREAWEAQPQPDENFAKAV